LFGKFLFLAISFMLPTCEATTGVPIGEMITNGDFIVSAGSSSFNDYSVEDGRFLYKGIPFSLGGVSRRDIVNPTQEQAGYSEAWSSRMEKFIDDIHNAGLNFMRVTTVIYWRISETGQPAVANDWYLFYYADGDPRLFRLDVIPDSDPGTTDFNQGYIDALETTLAYADDNGIMVELEFLDNCILRTNPLLTPTPDPDLVLRWSKSPFANCVESSAVWPTVNPTPTPGVLPPGVPYSGEEAFYTNELLRPYLRQYVAKIVNATEHHERLIYAVMNETAQNTNGNDLEEDIIQTIRDNDNNGHLIAINRYNQANPDDFARPGGPSGSPTPRPYYQYVDFVCLHGGPNNPTPTPSGHWESAIYWPEIESDQSHAIISTDGWRDRDSHIETVAKRALTRGLALDHEVPDSDEVLTACLNTLKGIADSWPAWDNWDLPNAGFIPNKNSYEVFDYDYDTLDLVYEPEEPISIIFRWNSDNMPGSFEGSLYVILTTPAGEIWCLYLDEEDDLQPVKITSFPEGLVPWDDSANSGDYVFDIPDGLSADYAGVYTFNAAFLDINSGAVTLMDDSRTDKAAIANMGFLAFGVGDGPFPAGVGYPPLLQSIGIFESARTVLIPYWQAGWGVQNLFSFYNYCPGQESRTALDAVLDLYDETGLVDSVSCAELAGGEMIHLKTTDQWYTGGQTWGAAVARLTYAEPPAADDLLAVWSLAYAETDGPMSGFGINLPGSPVIPPGSAPEGESVVPIPYWVNENGDESYFMAFNSPDSRLDAEVTFTFRSADGTPIPTPVTLVLAPGTCGGPAIPTVSPRGAGEVSVSFEGIPGPNERVSLYSQVYGYVTIPSPTPAPSSTPAGSVTPLPTVITGYTVDLKRNKPVVVSGAAVEHECYVMIPFWQEGWSQHTTWSAHNPADSEHDVWVSIELFGDGGYSGTPDESSDARKLSPGQSTVFGTYGDAANWYGLSGGRLGVAYLKLDYDDPNTSQTTELPSSNDTVAIWSAVYSIAPNGRRVGYQVTIPDSPICPVNIDANLTGHVYQGFGPGTYLQPFWARDNSDGEQMFWMVSSHPGSAGDAEVTLTIHSLDGQQSQYYYQCLEPGEAFALDTEVASGWYELDDGLTGAGEIEVAFTTNDPENRVQFWSTYYGFYNGLPLGFDVDIR